METQGELILSRLKQILDCFLEPNFATTNNVYIEKLLSHLSAKENAPLLQAPFVIVWVDKGINMLAADFSAVDSKVTAFLLNVCSLFALNEWTVILMREYKIMDRVMTIVTANATKLNPSMKLGTIRLISAVARYSLGLAYIRSAKSWHCLIDYCNNDHTLYVVRESRQLIYELLYKFSVKTKDEQIVVEMLGEILKPLLDNVFDESNKTIHIDVDDGEVQHKMSAALDLISYILQKTLESEEKTNLAQLCNTQFRLEMSIWKATETTQNPYFAEKIMTALTALNFCRLVDEKWQTGQIAPEDFNRFGLLFFNIMKFCIVRGDCVNFLKLAQLNHLLWKQLGDRAPQDIQVENERVRFENQLITFHLLPLLFMLKSKEFLTEELFDNYVMKLFHISCEQTLRTCYAFRDLLFRTEETSTQLVAELACKSIHGILSMEHKLDREQAILVFQAMIYALKQFLLKTHPELGENAPSNGASSDGKAAEDDAVELPGAVLHGVLVGLQTLIQRYRITWKDSIETICLVNLVGLLLETPNLTTRLVVQALKLLQLSIEHFLSPNMALLVDNLQGSGLSCLGPIIMKRFHDNAWEVRDSALELVTSIADISRFKFPALQQLLVDQKLCPIVHQMAKNDNEPYVRASAFKCLTKFVVITPIWDNELCKLDVIEHLFSVLYQETEGIVRKEAVDTLSKIYDHRKVLASHKNTLYSTLAHCAVSDLHWEVKVHALRFWEQEICRQFSNQGMIDGTFPTVTFSKEHKKIVTLTEREINVLIGKAFNELSQLGCLGVMLTCLNDDCDLEVIKTAVRIVYRLLEMLKKYDYELAVDTMPFETGAPAPEASEKANPAAVDAPPPRCAESNIPTTAAKSSLMDEVIESILDAQDINLLVAACERQLNVKDEVLEDDGLSKIADDFFKQYATVTAKHFIHSVQSMNLDQLLQKHQEWNLRDDSFISLLDDIICTVRQNEANEAIFADCY